MPSLLIDNSTTPALTCTELFEGAPTTNYVGGSLRAASSFASGDRRHLLLDFGAAPSLGGTVAFSVAALTLYCQDTSAATNDFSIYLVTSPTADTAQATWNNRATGVPWGTAGALGAGDVNLTPLDTVSDWVISTPRSFAGALLQSAVADWCNGVTSGLQILICRDPDTAYDFTYNDFRSTGWGAPDWPTLTGTYTVGSSGPTVSSITATSPTEAGNIVFTVTLSAAVSGSDATYAYSWGGTATSADYTQTLTTAMCARTGGASGAVTVSGSNVTAEVGVSAFTITVPTTTDALDENDETVILTLGGTVSSTSTITDDDALPSITGTTSVTVDAGDAVVITYTLSAVSGRAITRTLTVTDGTATGGGVDYTSTITSGMFSNGVTISGSTVTIPAGVSSFTLSIPTTA